jgi:hypothetical protein
MKSSTIVQFPRHGPTDAKSIDPSEITLKARKGIKKANKTNGLKILLNWSLGLIWLLLGLCWPLLKWLGALDVLFQCARVFYFSNTPNLHVTLHAGIHSGCYLLISLFVYLYRPKVF